ARAQPRAVACQAGSDRAAPDAGQPAAGARARATGIAKRERAVGRRATPLNRSQSPSPAPRGVAHFLSSVLDGAEITSIFGAGFGRTGGAEGNGGEVTV